MDQKSQRYNKGLYYPKRNRKDNYFSTSASQNLYRKPKSEKTYKKKPKEKYSVTDILSLQSNPQSMQRPDNPFLSRKILPFPKLFPNSNAPNLIKSELDNATKLMKSLLNKLTPTNFEQIESKLSDLLSPHSSKHLADLLLSKACLELKYRETYARLVKSLQVRYSKFREDLLQSCQKIFESDSWENCESNNDKKKLLGLVAFIGELINNKILSGKVLVLCCEQLLSKNSEIAAEGLCYLLSSFSGAFSGRYKETAHELVAKLQGQSSSFSSRIQFLVTDLIENSKIQNSLFHIGEKPQKLDY